MKETTPDVYLIARPQIDLEALERYLKTVGGESWLEMRREQDDGLNPGQLLIEAGGRACYRSWEPGLNPNVTRVRKDQEAYFLNLMRSGHGSVLEHANYSFILDNVSRVFCYDEDTEVLTDEGWKPWPKVTGEELFGTLNPHNGFLEYQRCTERFERDYVGPMYEVESEHINLLVTPNHRMWVQPVDTQAYRRREEAFAIHEARNILHKRARYMKCAQWEGREANASELCAKTFAERARTHKVPFDRLPEYVQQWERESIRQLLDSLVENDGAGNEVIYADSQEAADDIQVLAIKGGYAADVDLAGDVEPGTPLRRRYVVSLSADQERFSLINDGEHHDRFVHYEGRVYCAKVPNGLLFVRRKGRACVSGNTHELVRHRAGSAFSQESLRFVRLDDIPFRIPEVLEPLRPQIVSILETLDEFQISAAEHFELDKEGVPFHKKKEITSALRRLAPAGLTTVIFWTANVRTLRHTIQMRTDPGAEEEIRFVFDKIGKIMLQEAPLLFGDFKVEDGAWVTDYKKV